MRLRGRERVSTAVSGWLPSGAPYVFTPADLSPTLWLDASDTSTITSSGSPAKVSQWDDKSGNGYNVVQAVGASQPTTGADTINGLNVIDFDGSNDFLSVADFDMTGTQQVTLAVVMTAVSSASFRIIAEHGTDGQNGAWTTFKNTTDKFAFQKSSTADASFETTGALSTTEKVVVAVHDGTLSTNEVTVWMNNSNAGTRFNNSNTNSGNVNATLRIGARQGTSLFLNGQIAELVITKSAVSTIQRESLQNYLAAKWGITF